ncbi:MAG: sulfotransferase [Flavobacteriaceae bacterium]
MIETSNEKLKVIYLMGSGRSGSTLMNIIFGNHPEVVAPGELNNVNRLKQEKFTCSCGERVEECDFWKRVMHEWKNRSSEANVKAYLGSMHQIERSKSPMAWLKLRFKSHNKERFEAYLSETYNLLKSIQIHSEKPVIVDISKNPLRAYAMMQHPNIDMRVIHLVRDARGVSWSLNKFVKAEVKQQKVWRTSLFWVVVNKLSNFVRKKSENSGLILYEDFIASPEETTIEICKICEIDPQPIIDIIKGDVALKGAHIMAGNKLRKEKSITLKLDTSWHKNMEPKKHRIVKRIAGRTMKRYGYQLNLNATSD